jgi:hypothetical protein
MLAGGPAERFLGFPESLAVRLNGLVPTWLDGAFGAHRAALRTDRTAPVLSTPIPLETQE